MTKTEAQPFLGIDIVRHGKSSYKQQEVAVELADDLTPEGISAVKEGTQALAEIIKPDEEIAIWSSPLGRAIHTAKIIAETLKQKGFHPRKKGVASPWGIKVFQELTEVKGFSWSLFSPLINGGQVDLNGRSFFVKKEETNPNNLPYPDYYIQDAIADIPPEVRQSLPPDYVEVIEGFEKFREVTERLMRPLSRLKELRDKPYRVIIVGHDSQAMFLANLFSAGQKKGLDPGEFVNLERTIRGDLVITRVGNLTKGENKLDAIKEFNKF